MIRLIELLNIIDVHLTPMANRVKSKTESLLTKSGEYFTITIFKSLRLKVEPDSTRMKVTRLIAYV